MLLFVCHYEPSHGIPRDCREGIAIADLLSELYLPDSESAVISSDQALLGQEYQLDDWEHFGVFHAEWGG